MKRYDIKFSADKMGIMVVERNYGEWVKASEAYEEIRAAKEKYEGDREADKLLVKALYEDLFDEDIYE